MWKFYELLILVLICCDIKGEIDDDMKSIMDECCSVGSEFGRSHTEEDCAASQPVPSHVPSHFRSIYLMCIMARAVCCTGHVQQSHYSQTSSRLESATEPNRQKLDYLQISTTHNEGAESSYNKELSGPIPHKELTEPMPHKKATDPLQNKKPQNSNYPTPEKRWSIESTPVTTEMTIAQNITTTTSAQMLAPLVTQSPSISKYVQCNVLKSGGCECPQGYIYVGNGTCEDIDECSIYGSSLLCFSNSDCVNTVGSYDCVCHSGFRPGRRKVCMDIDECLEHSADKPLHQCQQWCGNTYGSYQCSCYIGYQNVSGICVDINECEDKKSVGYACKYKCLNEPGSYRCICPKGYKRATFDLVSCVDINECDTGEASCQTSTGNTTSTTCFNIGGSYRCINITCPPGYELLNQNQCTTNLSSCPGGESNCTHEPTSITYHFMTFPSKHDIRNVLNFRELLFFGQSRVPGWPFSTKFTLRPITLDKADIGDFLMTDADSYGLLFLIRSIEGPQSIELEISMETRKRDQLVEIVLHKIYLYISEYESLNAYPTMIVQK